MIALFICLSFEFPLRLDSIGYSICSQLKYTQAKGMGTLETLNINHGHDLTSYTLKTVS